MNKLAMLLLCASSRCRGSSAMLLERIRTVTGGEMIFLPQRIVWTVGAYHATS